MSRAHLLWPELRLLRLHELLRRPHHLLCRIEQRHPADTTRLYHLRLYSVTHHGIGVRVLLHWRHSWHLTHLHHLLLIVGIERRDLSHWIAWHLALVRHRLHLLHGARLHLKIGLIHYLRGTVHQRWSNHYWRLRSLYHSG